MKITIPKLFELFQIAPDLAPKVSPLVDFINGAVDQVVKALQGRLTIRDNGFAEIRELSFKKPSGASTPWVQTFTPAQRTVEGVLLLQTSTTGEAEPNTISSWRWAFLSSGAIEISIYPREPSSTKALTAKFVVLFQ